MNIFELVNQMVQDHNFVVPTIIIVIMVVLSKVIASVVKSFYDSLDKFQKVMFVIITSVVMLSVTIGLIALYLVLNST